MKKSILVLLSGIVLFASCSKAENKRTSSSTTPISSTNETSSPPTVEELLKKYGLDFFTEIIPEGCKRDLQSLENKNCYSINKQSSSNWTIFITDEEVPVNSLKIDIISKSGNTVVIFEEGYARDYSVKTWKWKSGELTPLNFHLNPSDFFQGKNISDEYQSNIGHSYDSDKKEVTAYFNAFGDEAFEKNPPKYEYKLTWDGENWVKNKQKASN